MSNVITLNEAHKRYLADRVMGHLEPGASVLLIGLTFKADTDDLRESPLIDLAEAAGDVWLVVVGKGVDIDRDGLGKRAPTVDIDRL